MLTGKDMQLSCQPSGDSVHNQMSDPLVITALSLQSMFTGDLDC
jgi:hypothetical protein